MRFTLKTYVVLFHGGLSKEKLTEEYLKRFTQWAKDVSQDKIGLGNRLQPNGKILSSRNGENTSDVSFGSELVGGYIVMEAEDYYQAASKLRKCPILENGGTVEVREIIPMQM